MHKLLTLGLASLFLVVTGCQDTNTTGPLAGPSFHVSGGGGGVTTAEADLGELNGSGIEGEIEFTDDGSTLTIAGKAEGMDPTVTYVSLIYDNGSVATGAEACEPTIFTPGPGFLLPTMFIGVWSVDEDGKGTLAATNTEGGADYVPLGKFRTMSIRNTGIDGGFGPAAVAACGVVETDAENDEAFDMNDRFATETGASGSGDVEWEDGSVEIEVEAEGLLPNHLYELKVTIGVGGDATLGGFDGASVGIVTFGPVTSDQDGRVEFKEDLDLLGDFGPGLYRLDFFVTHDHPEGPGSGAVGVFLTGLLGSEPLLACEPAPSFIVIAADD